MFVARAVRRVTRCTHQKYAVAFINHQLAVVRSISDNAKVVKSTPEPSACLHLSIAELCHQKNGLENAMKFIQSSGAGRDVSLVGYLSVMDFALAQLNPNAAFQAYLEIQKLGVQMESSMAYKFIRLQVSQEKIVQLEQAMKTQLVISGAMMARLAELILYRRSDLYLEYMTRYLNSAKPPKPMTVIKVAKYFQKARQSIEFRKLSPEMIEHGHRPASPREVEDFRQVDLLLDAYFHKEFPEAMSVLSGAPQDEETEEGDLAAGESDDDWIEGEDSEDREDDSEELDDTYHIRESICELNSHNCHHEVDPDSIPEEFRFSDVNERSWVFFSDTVRQLTTKTTVPTHQLHSTLMPDDLDSNDWTEEDSLAADASSESDDEQMELLPDHFSIPVGEVEHNGKMVGVEMHFVRNPEVIAALKANAMDEGEDEDGEDESELEFESLLSEEEDVDDDGDEYEEEDDDEEVIDARPVLEKLRDVLHVQALKTGGLEAITARASSNNNRSSGSYNNSRKEMTRMSGDDEDAHDEILKDFQGHE